MRNSTFLLLLLYLFICEFFQSTHPDKLAAFNKAASDKTTRNRKRFATSTIPNVHKLKQSKIDNFDKNRCISRSEYNKATAKLIINTASPFYFVENKAFIEFCKTISNQSPMCRTTLMKDLNQSFEEMKKDLMATLKNIESVCVTADLWTAFQRAYLGVTVHWLDPVTLKRNSKGLACRRVMGRHTFDVLADSIDEILTEFKIQNKTALSLTTPQIS